MYICPKCKNTKDIYVYVQSGTVGYTLNDNDTKTLVSADVDECSSYLCAHCNTGMKYQE